MYRASVFFMDNGLIAGTLDDAFVEFVFGSKFLKRKNLALFLPKLFARLGWFSWDYVTGLEYATVWSRCPKTVLSSLSRRFAAEKFPALMKKGCRNLLKKSSKFGEVVILTSGLSEVAKECMSSIGASCRVVGNELSSSGGVIIDGKTENASCCGDNRFLMMCDALTVSPDEIWIFGINARDPVFDQFATVFVDMSVSPPRIVRGGAEAAAFLESSFV